MNRTRLLEILERIHALDVLVVGDYFLDKYLNIERRLSEVSLETGLEAYQVTGVRTSPGAAGTVVNNLCALGAQVVALGVIGDTGEGYELRRELAARGVDDSLLLVRPGLVTPTYIKPMLCERDGRVHELERLDLKNRAPLDDDSISEFLVLLRRALNAAHAVIVSEYIPASEGGVISDAVRDEILAHAAAQPGKAIIVDSRPALARYRGVILKCNLREALQALGYAPAEKLPLRDVLGVAGELAKRTGFPLFLTLGAEGMLVCTAGECTHVPTLVEPGPVDTVGAGDSAVAGIACALGAGASSLEAALIGNLAASVTIKKIGTTGTASPAEILDNYERWERSRAV